tara:strand:- start:111 stop:290 length:180 start_codon:yes stop_codon:yes gene_type:complete
MPKKNKKDKNNTERLESLITEFEQNFLKLEKEFSKSRKKIQKKIDKAKLEKVTKSLKSK